MSAYELLLLLYSLRERRQRSHLPSPISDLAIARLEKLVHVSYYGRAKK